METLTARQPVDLLALVPVVLGFEPSDSIVMLTIDAEQTFHARVDLPPPDRASVAAVVRVLLEPVVRHRVRSVVLVFYTADHALAQTLVRRLRRGIDGRPGPRLLAALRADGGRWFPLVGEGSEDSGGRGVPYDVSTHPFVLDAVVSGRVLHRSREELAATLRPDPAAVAVVSAVRLDHDPEPEEVVAAVTRAVAEDRPPSPEVVARLLAGVADPAGRVAAWSTVARAEAADHARLWAGVLPRAPADLAVHAAAMLALCAWLAGDGARAWCAVDRAREVATDHPLAELVADLLTGAVPPSAWESAVRAMSAGP